MKSNNSPWQTMKHCVEVSTAEVISEFFGDRVELTRGETWLRGDSQSWGVGDNEDLLRVPSTFSNPSFSSEVLEMYFSPPW